MKQPQVHICPKTFVHDVLLDNEDDDDTVLAYCETKFYLYCFQIIMKQCLINRGQQYLNRWKRLVVS